MLDKLINQVIHLQKIYYNSTKAGDIINRLNDSERIQSVIVDVVNILIIEIFTIILTAIYLFYYSWHVGLIILIYVPILVFISYSFSRKINNAQRNVMISYSWLEAKFINLISNIDTIRAFNLQKNITKETNKEYANAQNNVFSLGKISTLYNFTINLVTGFVLISVFSLSTYLTIIGIFKIGILVAVISIFGMIVSSATKISSFLMKYNEAAVAFDRIYDFYKNDIEEIHTEDKLNDVFIEADINKLDIQDLSYRYEGQSLLFDKLNFSIKTGQINLIIGEVGTGKTTLLNLIERFYHFESGNIYFNNKDITQIPLFFWREQIGILFQETKLFEGKIYENISKTDDKQNILNFCIETGFITFFENFISNIDSQISENGNNLSGGQKQVIGLARAVYKKPKILILDEPTSNLDIETKNFVIDFLSKIKKKVAIIIITHDNSLSGIADNIYVLNDKKLHKI